MSHPELISALRRTLGDAEGRKILEVGAGMGGDSIELARMRANLCAVDFLYESLTSIREFAASAEVEVETVQGNALALPFRDRIFDVVFHQGLLEHFREAEQLQLLRENWRVLRPGGFMLVDVPQKYCEYTIRKRRLMRQGVWFAGWETEFSAPELAHALRRVGFRVLELYPRGYFGTIDYLRLRFATEPAQGRSRFVPSPVRRAYRKLWQRIERSPLALFLCFSVGVVGRKPLHLKDIESELS